ncbi:MAG: tRNA lysidine(34) synthetase TilS [Synergistaceae bacterium]|nr:tRNA lysidine(34) synthetase TilS [Synergistaceae bacterium]
MGKRREAKVKSLLIDRKIPHGLRDRVPIFTAGGDIFWVGGIRRAAVALLTAETRRRIAFRIEWDDEKENGEEN